MGIQYSSEIKNDLAPKLSELTACGAPEIEPFPPIEIAAILQSRLFFRFKEPYRRLRVRIILNSSSAITEYRQGRENLYNYISYSQRQNEQLFTYIKALAHFENFIFKCATAFYLIGRCLQKLPESIGDEGEIVRLFKIYNRLKHFDEDLAGHRKTSRLARSDLSITAPMWITNEGIESEKYKLEWHEIVEMMEYLKMFCVDLSMIHGSKNLTN